MVSRSFFLWLGKGGKRGEECYRAFQLEGFEVGGVVWLQLYGAGVEGGEEGFGEGELGHGCGCVG